jgi:hypothetical protein
MPDYLQPIAPIPRTTFLVCNCNNADTIRFDNIENTVWKANQEFMANFITYKLVCLWILPYLVNSIFNGIEEG